MTDVYIFTASNKVAFKHFQDTIEQPVSDALIKQHLPADEYLQLQLSMQGTPTYAWVAQPGSGNQTTWGLLAPGDYVLGYAQGGFVRLARVAMKTKNQELATALWSLEDGDTWEMMYFLRDMQVIDYPLSMFIEDLHHGPTYHPFGFSKILESRLAHQGGADSFIANRVATPAETETLREWIESELSDDSSLVANQEENELSSELGSTLSLAQVEEVITDLDQQLRSGPPGRQQKAYNAIERNGKLARLVKEQRGYDCQLCGDVIRNTDGSFYAEAHHIDPLFQGGLDFSRNLVVVCPNCHKRFHHSGAVKSKHDDHHFIVTIEKQSYDVPLERKYGSWAATVSQQTPEADFDMLVAHLPSLPPAVSERRLAVTSETFIAWDSMQPWDIKGGAFLRGEDGFFTLWTPWNNPSIGWVWRGWLNLQKESAQFLAAWLTQPEGQGALTVPPAIARNIEVTFAILWFRHPDPAVEMRIGFHKFKDGTELSFQGGGLRRGGVVIAAGEGNQLAEWLTVDPGK